MLHSVGIAEIELECDSEGRKSPLNTLSGIRSTSSRK